VTDLSRKRDTCFRGKHLDSEALETAAARLQIIAVGAAPEVREAAAKMRATMYDLARGQGRWLLVRCLVNRFGLHAERKTTLRGLLKLTCRGSRGPDGTGAE
jgi:hypothetical protein